MKVNAEKNRKPKIEIDRMSSSESGNELVMWSSSYFWFGFEIIQRVSESMVAKSAKSAEQSTKRFFVKVFREM